MGLKQGYLVNEGGAQQWREKGEKRETTHLGRDQKKKGGTQTRESNPENQKEPSPSFLL